MLDVIIIKSVDTPGLFVDACLASVNAAKTLAPFPVNVIVVPGVPGHIGQAMINGLALTSSTYVCWVDDDDYLLPHAFTAIAASLFLSPPAVCAREIELYANGNFKPCTVRHHLTIYKTLWVKQQDLTPFRATPNVALLKRLPLGTIDLQQWLYVRRIRLSGGMKLRGLHQQAESKLWQ